MFFGFHILSQLASRTPINGKGVVIIKYPSNPTVALVYLSAAFLLACIVAGLFSSLSCSKSTSFFVIINGNTSFCGNVFCSFQHKVDPVDYVGFACVREYFACENLCNFFYLLSSGRRFVYLIQFLVVLQDDPNTWTYVSPPNLTKRVYARSCSSFFCFRKNLQIFRDVFLILISTLHIHL